MACALPLHAAGHYGELAQKLLTHIPRQTAPVRMAVVNFKVSGEGKGLPSAEDVKDELEVELGRDSRVQLVTRTDIGELEKEWSFQETTSAHPDTQTEQPKIAGVDVLVRGRVCLRENGEICIFAEVLQIASGAIAKEKVSWVPAAAEPLVTAPRSAPQPVCQPACQPQMFTGSLEQRAAAGDMKAQVELGFNYRDGKNGYARNAEQAFYWFKQAAEQGSREGQNCLGNCYHRGLGCAVNLNQAFYWYKQSADAGAPLAKSNLGTCYENGWGTPKDKGKAVELYREAARLGNPSAQRHLKRLGLGW